MIIRNQLDVAHITLREPDSQDVRVLVDFCLVAASSVEIVLDHVLLSVIGGESLAPVSGVGLARKRKKLLDDLKSYLGSTGNHHPYSRGRTLITFGRKNTRGEAAAREAVGAEIDDAADAGI